MSRVLFVQQSLKRKRKSAFTLIELLVVVAIISILASILFPVFARTRENARRTSCMSNLKQIGLGVMQYTQDYDERYPLAAYKPIPTPSGGEPNNPVGGQADSSYPGYIYGHRNMTGATLARFVTWMDLIHPYIKNTQVFRCPSLREGGHPHMVNNGPGLIIPSYGYSEALGNWHVANTRYCDGCGTRDIPLTLSQVTYPASTYMVVEYQDAYAWVANPFRQGALARNASNSQYVAPHLDGANNVYADGHAKWVNINNLKAISVPDGRCYPDRQPLQNVAFCDKNWNPYIG